MLIKKIRWNPHTQMKFLPHFQCYLHDKITMLELDVHWKKRKNAQKRILKTRWKFKSFMYSTKMHWGRLLLGSQTDTGFWRTILGGCKLESKSHYIHGRAIKKTASAAGSLLKKYIIITGYKLPPPMVESGWEFDTDLQRNSNFLQLRTESFVGLLRARKKPTPHTHTIKHSLKIR